MKPIKMLGLAMLAALTAMAFVGASSAMAEPTQLCEVDIDPCPEPVTHVHEETLPEKPGILLNSTKENVECDVLFLSTVEIHNEGTEAEEILYLGVLGLGEPQIIHGHFTYSNCFREGKKCEVKEVSEDSLILILREGHDLAKVTGHGEVNVHCGLLINCTYKGENLVGHGLGALLPGELEKLGGVLIDNQTTVKVSGLCPEVAELDLTTTPLKDLFITS
ncbi:MAG: hypothetical protein ACM3N0_01640 [Chloroflexota bacterium]